VPVLDPVHVERPRFAGGPGSAFSAQVIVVNDDHNTFEHVIVTFCRVLPSMTPPKAERLAWTIHRSGRATVWSGNREAAELYVEQLTGAGLRAELD
jgi:ATP-dependent Clp protease adaptor protein ClpS